MRTFVAGVLALVHETWTDETLSPGGRTLSADAHTLLIDCQDARAALEGLGLPVRTVSSQQRALRNLKESSLAAIVIGGKGLSDGDAPEMLKTLRRRAPRTPIFVWGPRLRSGLVRAVLMNGATDVVLDVSPEALAERLQSALDKNMVLPPLERMQRARDRGRAFHGLASRNDAMWDLFETCVRVAPTDATVLILGETGTGKERIARAIHKLSRRAGRWVALNCGAVPAALLESELFGHEKGAFTGANREKAGLFRHADGGTLFLDEIGNMTPEAQFSLLRTLQEGTVRPVGAQEQIPVDVRIVAATNVALEEAVAADEFREDLLYRLDVIRLVVPPLRERREDILHLFSHFVKKFAKYHARKPPQLTAGFTEAMLEHDWPGNVRELENLVERLILTHRGKPLNRRQFASLKRGFAKSVPSSSRQQLDTRQPLAAVVEDAERLAIRAALKRHHGRIQEAAEALEVNRRTLLRKLKKYGIDKHEFQDD